MDRLDAFADLSIRRACAFVALAAVTVMLSLSFDLMLAFRTGAQMAAILAIALVFSAWRAPRRDIHHTEVYAMLRSAGLPRDRLRQPDARAQIARVLRERLSWHAERVAATAIAFYLLAAFFWILSPA